MDEFLKSVIPTPLEIEMKSTEENEIENVEPTGRIPLEEKIIEQNHHSKVTKILLLKKLECSPIYKFICFKMI